MEYHARIRILFLLLVAIIAVMALAASLPVLQLQPGQPFPLDSGQDPSSAAAGEQPSADSFALPFVEGGLALIFIAAVAVLMFSLFIHVNFKKVLLFTLVTLGLFGLLVLLPRITPAASTPGAMEEQYTQSLPQFTGTTSTLGDPPQGLGWVVAGSLVAFLVTYAVWQIRRKPPAATPPNNVLQEAQAAVSALHAGADLNNVIIQCYERMNAVLSAEQGIEREAMLTAQEFETILETQGYPRAPLHQLTRLFEKARYSNAPLTEQDQSSALSCLTAILEHCRGMRA